MNKMNMRYTNKWLCMLLVAASASLVGCKKEELNTNGTEQRDPNLISVSFDMSAGVQDTMAEDGAKTQGRGLSDTLEDGEKDGKKSFSLLKFNAEKAPETLEAYGIFYCPAAPKGKRVYISNGPMQWTKKTVNGDRVRYEIHKGGIVDIDRSLMDGTHQWYFAAVLGAEYDAATKSFSFDPYKDAKANGLTYQFNGEPINLNLPMTTNWSKLKVREPESGSTEHWFYPEEYVITQGLPEGVSPAVVFRPRGTVFRMRINNESINDLRIMSYNLESNVLAFKATLAIHDIIDQQADAVAGKKLKLTPVMKHPAEVLVFDKDGTAGRIVQKKHESASGVTLAWAYLNEGLLEELTPNLGENGDEDKASKEAPYFAVRATANPVGDDHWNSMQKAADYYPIENRISYITQAPVYYAYVNQLDKHYKDGGSEWLRVKITTSLTNLERTTFEAIGPNYTPGKVGAFKRGHPWMNRHADNNNYYLDFISYPNLAELKKWLTPPVDFKSENNDPDMLWQDGEKQIKTVLSSKANGTSYYLPHAEEIQSYLPIPVGAGATDSLYLPKGIKKAPFDVQVIEQDLNLKHDNPVASVHTARFVLKGGDNELVNTLNYGKDLKTGASIPMTGNIGWTPDEMKPYNYFNYYWCSHVVYGLAYLRKGDPESLVAYRYFWGISPENSGVPLGSNSIGGFVDGAKTDVIFGPEDAAILKNSNDPRIGETQRKISAWSGGRMNRSGLGKSMISFFSVGMRYVGRFDPKVRSLGDIDVVSDEKWWTSDPQNVVFRIFTAVGFVPGKSLPVNNDNDVVNRNRGAYILTQTNSDNDGNHDYFYIGPRSWGRFNTKNEPALSDMWLKNHEGEGKYYRTGGQTPKYKTDNQKVYDGAPNQYYISRAYLPAESGAPTHFMVGTDPKTK